jgi:hypothetical protein
LPQRYRSRFANGECLEMSPGNFPFTDKAHASPSSVDTDEYGQVELGDPIHHRAGGRQVPRILYAYYRPTDDLGTGFFQDPAQAFRLLRRSRHHYP